MVAEEEVLPLKQTGGFVPDDGRMTVAVVGVGGTLIWGRAYGYHGAASHLCGGCLFLESGPEGWEGPVRLHVPWKKAQGSSESAFEAAGWTDEKVVEGVAGSAGRVGAVAVWAHGGEGRGQGRVRNGWDLGSAAAIAAPDED